MESLESIQSKLDSFFNISQLDLDPAFSRFLPNAYDSINYDWKNKFEGDFVKRFNGLMIKGESTVGTIFLAVFPTEDVISTFIEEATDGI